MQKTHNSISIIAALLILLLGAGASMAQLRISSPYSRYGLGELTDISLYARSAGGMAYSLRDSITINRHNPASFSAFDPGSFLCEIGLNSTFTQLQTAEFDQDYFNHTSLSCITFGFPVTRWWGASLGLVPYSRAGYKLTVADTVTGIGKVGGVYEGFGGLNRFYFGNGFKLHRDISAGFNMSFLFGALNNNSAVYFRDIPYAFNTRITSTHVINDLNFELGAQYNRELNKRRFISAGLVYKIPYNMSGRKSYLVERFTLTGSNYEVTQDTIENIQHQPGKVYMPGGLYGGISLGQKQRWAAGLDLGWQNWKKYQSFGQSDSLKSSLFGGIGFSITPNYGTVSNYFKRITYRASLKYYSSYLKLHGQPVNEWAVSMGFDFPLRSRTLAVYSIQAALEYGQKGTTSYDLIRENFFRINIGFTIREHWFFRRAID
jgi:hypothetical protein